MARREWVVLGGIAVAAIVGLALEPDHGPMAEHRHVPPITSGATATTQTITLAISGMT